MNIHYDALAEYGLHGRLAKLRTEATEVANKIDRYDEGKATLVEVVLEIWDFLFVLVSITKSHEYRKAEREASSSRHNRKSEMKLRKAINDRRTPQ